MGRLRQWRRRCGPRPPELSGRLVVDNVGGASSPGHLLSMPLSPPQVWLVSNALQMHIQCRCSASAVQL